MTTYTWKVIKMAVLPFVEGSADVVVSAQWSITGVDESFGYSISDWSQFTLDQGKGFTPYNQLTEQQVLDWIKQQMGDDKITVLESKIQNRIDAQRNPITEPTSQPLPWTQE